MDGAEDCVGGCVCSPGSLDMGSTRRDRRGGEMELEVCVCVCVREREREREG